MSTRASDASRVPRRSSWKKVVVGKISFDIISLAFLLGVTRVEEVIFSARATTAELLDTEILCLGAGGAGQTEKSNYNYKVGDLESSLTKKVHEAGGLEIPFWQANRGASKDDFGLGIESSDELRRRISRFVQYAYFLHELGNETLKAEMKVGSPTLAEIFEAMMVCEKDPVEQFFKGIEILAKVIRNGQEPFGAIQGFEIYIGAARKTG